MRKSFGSGGIKAPKTPTFGSASGGNSLMNMMMAQSMLGQKKEIERESSFAGKKQEQAELKSILPEETVLTGATGPFNEKYQTAEGQTQEINTDIQKRIRGKAVEDAQKLAGLLPVLEDLKGRYNEAYAGIKAAGKPMAGIGGAISATEEFISGGILRGNSKLRSLAGLMSLYRPQVIKGAGDTGNFSVVEQQWAGKAMPDIGTNWKVDQLFMPDDPEMGVQRLNDLHSMFTKKYLEAVRVAETGEYKGTGYESNYLNKLRAEQGTASEATQSSSGLPHQTGSQAPEDIEAKKERIRKKYLSI